MQKVYVLTQDQCPNCHALHQFLQLALKDKYAPHIIKVHKSIDEALYRELVSMYNIKETPSLIYQDEIIQGFKPQITLDLFQKHFGS
jgi:hypothetical protein